MSYILLPNTDKYKVQPREGQEVTETVHVFPYSQESQHCFDFVMCKCQCCYPEIEELAERTVIRHNWIQ